MSGPGSLLDLQELLGPIHTFFDGIVWVLHDSVGSEEEEYLNSIKGCGRIINYYYHRRHDQSRNQYLWCGPIKNGDWIVQTDLLERLDVGFASQVRETCKKLREVNINLAYFEGKPLMYEYHESIIFRGSPHEGLVRDDGNARSLILDSYYTESKPRLNVRNIKRPNKFGWVDHYLNYYLFPFGSNHCLLGLDSIHKDSNLLIQAFQKREKLRIAFLTYLEYKNIDRTVDAVKALFQQTIDKDLALMINNELILNDFYRYHILKDNTVIDNHDHLNLKPII